MAYHCIASFCTMLCSVTCLKCKLQLNLQFIQKKKGFSWSFLDRWHSVFRPFYRSFLVKTMKVVILTIKFIVWVSLCCWLNSSLFLFLLHKKVVPSVQGSSFCGIWERWLVGSLTLNLVRLILGLDLNLWHIAWVEGTCQRTKFWPICFLTHMFRI